MRVPHVARFRIRALIAASSIGLLIGASAGSAWLGAQFAHSGGVRGQALRLMQVSLSGEAESFDVAALHNSLTGSGSDEARGLDERALRLTDTYLGQDSGLFTETVVAMRLSSDARVKGDGQARLIRTSLSHTPGVTVRAAAPVVLASANQNDLDCLTQAVYYEARGEGTDGMRAVAQVILNRVRHPAFPKTICSVVYQGAYLRTGCQFSFACDGSVSRRQEPVAWRRARSIAQDAMNGTVMPSVGSATHFHTLNVQPRWAANMVRLSTVGMHVFYQFGGRGSRLNGADSIQPSDAVPVVIADATTETPEAALAATAPEAALSQIAVAAGHGQPVSATLKGADAAALTQAVDGPAAGTKPVAAPVASPVAKPSQGTRTAALMSEVMSDPGR